ncbi:hypothetical protein AB3X93_40370, partial [Paraburkholderia sp. BR14262]|uniref:hypothetical protein n=1 Tax=Paraburkholderia sp. BR14262 TaxID=3236999 RepID=UPI0034CF8E82
AHFDWRALFAFSAPAGVLYAVLALLALPDTGHLLPEERGEAHREQRGGILGHGELFFRRDAIKTHCALYFNVNVHVQVERCSDPLPEKKNAREVAGVLR